MYDVVAIGELLIDFSTSGKSDNGNILFERNPGGAPGNVLAAVAKLGGKTAFIGKVGKDQFGEFLKGVLDDIGVDTKGLVFTEEANTTLAFVHLDDKGDRSFSFYRNPGADMLLNDKDLDETMLKETRIFHFGTVSMTDDPSRTATLKAVKLAKANGVIISFDPNLRPPLWKSLDTAKEIMCDCLEYCDILKVSQEELTFITGFDSLEKGTEVLYEKYGTQLILVTLGPKGCFYRLGKNTGKLNTYDVNTIDTTGAGDAFLGAFLSQLISKKNSLAEISQKGLEYMIDFANAAGSLATVKKGAIPAMPSRDEILFCMKNVQKLIRDE